MAQKNGLNRSNKKIKIYKTKKNPLLKEDEDIIELTSKYASFDQDNITSFKDFPLSDRTLRGLTINGYKKPTEIQAQSIGPALQGRDILGAARTGSGKTLAFLIPMLEALYVNKWTKLDGLGALIMSPTRELAYQIFNVLRKVGEFHDFSVALIIGGQNLKFERKRMDLINIIICTPGRIKQHMEENHSFDCSNIKVLVLDEADRCLDLGFKEQMNQIIEYLPKERQTLLFSATQTKSVQDLVRLSLTDPLYVAPHDSCDTVTPTSLQQNYVVVELHEKISVLYSFITNHTKHKVIVFLSTCKQVKFVYDVFCKFRPGTSLLALYGSLHQERRRNIYDEFCRKQNIVLFCTDIAARGLDFPAVHWVVQLDCPEDTDAYIHRVGRTARHLSRGESLLVLLPSEEEAMVNALTKRKIPINRIKIDPSKIRFSQEKLVSLLTEYPEIKFTAQRAFVAYFKSTFLMKDKSIFNIHALDSDSFATSLGLAIPPRIRFLQKYKKKTTEKLNGDKSEDTTAEKLIQKSDESSDESDNGIVINKNNKQKVKLDDSSKTKTDMKPFFDNNSDDDESDEDFLKIKRKNHNIAGTNLEPESEPEPELEIKNPKSKTKVVTKAAIAKKIIKKKIVPNTKTVFNDDGEAVLSETKNYRSDVAKAYQSQDVGGIDIEEAKKVLREEDKFDKARFREKIRSKHRDEKKKLKQKDQEEMDDFGSDSEDEGPDLSFLPDPDKIYGPKKGSEEEDDSDNYQNEIEDNESEDEKTFDKRKKNRKRLRSEESSEDDSEEYDEEEVVHKPKRKLLTKSKNKIVKQKGKFSITDISQSLSVNEAEELAMKLLSSKR